MFRKLCLISLGSLLMVSFGSVSWGADRSWLLYESGQGDQWQIYLARKDGKEVKRLTDQGKENRYPAWSPDGNHVAFVSNRDGNQEIYVMDVTGENQVNLTHSPGQD